MVRLPEPDILKAKKSSDEIKKAKHTSASVVYEWKKWFNGYLTGVCVLWFF